MKQIGYKAVMRRRRACRSLALWVAASVAFSAHAQSPGSVDAAPPGGPSLAARLAEIQSRVQQVLVYPPLARRRAVEGTTLVAFDVDARGRAQAVRTRSSSGSALLDAAAERAVADAAPLPFVYGHLVIPVRFELDELR